MVSPLHFDETHMVVHQLLGRKRLLILPPSAYAQLRPFPLSHHLDRRARCDVAALDEPTARALNGVEVATQRVGNVAAWQPAPSALSPLLRSGAAEQRSGLGLGRSTAE